MRAAVLLLAGGESRRMGRDKARLRIRGRRAADWILDAFPDAPRIAATGRRHLGIPGCLAVPDPPGARGPLAGLAAGLEASPRRWVLALTCDQLPPSRALQALLWRSRKGRRAVLLSEGGRPVPFPGLYRKDLLPLIRRLLARGLGPSALKGNPGVRLLDAGAPEGWNTPAEFRRAIRHLTAPKAPPRMRP